MSEDFILQATGSPSEKSGRLPVFLLAALTVLTLTNTVGLFMLYHRVSTGVPVILPEELMTPVEGEDGGPAIDEGSAEEPEESPLPESSHPARTSATSPNET